jgi:hypothetical protein
MDWMSGILGVKDASTENKVVEPTTQQQPEGPSVGDQFSAWGSSVSTSFTGLFSSQPSTQTTTETKEEVPVDQGPSFSESFNTWTSNVSNSVQGIFTPSATPTKEEDFSYVKHLGEIPETCQPPVLKNYVRQNLTNQVFPDELEAFNRLKQTDISNQFSDNFLMACLFSKKLDVPRVEILLKNNLQWRTENNYIDVPSWDSLQKELFLSGFAMKIPGARTKRGEGIVYITMRHLIPKNHPPFIEHAIKWVVWHGMKASLWENMDYFRNGIVVVADLTDMGWDNLDLENATKMGSSFIDNFPMRLSKIILVRPPWLISTVLDAFSFFMKKKIMDRIVSFEENDKLLEFIDAENLHESLGGNLKYTIPDWFEFIENQYKEDNIIEEAI